MKKVISVLMAVAMLAALMVPAFALTEADGNPASDTAEVKTNYDNLVPPKPQSRGARWTQRFNITSPPSLFRPQR